MAGNYYVVISFNVKTVTTLLFSILLLSACGGGGGGGGNKNVGPVVTVNAPGNIEERTQVQLSIDARDPDGTIRDILWTQISGPTINFTDGSETIDFIVPEVLVDTDFSFSIAVVDNVGAITAVDLRGTIVNVARNNNAPETSDSTLTVTMNGSLDFSLPATDPDGDVLIYTITVEPQNGRVDVLDAINNLYRYKPNFNSLEDDELTFVVSDGELTASAKVFFDIVATAKKQLLISEVSSSQYYDDNRWIELYNGTGKAINLAEFSVKTDAMDLSTYLNSGTKAISLPDKIMPEDSYIVIQYRYAFNLWYSNIINSEQHIVIGDNSQISRANWNNSGFVELLNTNTDQTIDFVRFGNSQQTPSSDEHWNVGLMTKFNPNDLGKSLVRSVNNLDSNSVRDWYYVDQITLAAKNPINIH